MSLPWKYRNPGLLTFSPSMDEDTESLAKAPRANSVSHSPPPPSSAPAPVGGGGLSLSRLCQECGCSRARQGERAVCCLLPRGWVEGHACCQAGEGASSAFLPSPLPRSPSSWAAQGPGDTDSFQGQPQLHSRSWLSASLQNGQMYGQGAAALCQQLLP